jgi:hypothetical protein
VSHHPFDNQAAGGTIKIHNEAINWLLSPELITCQPAVT